MQATLARTARDLCEGLRGRAMPAENLHITLAFLGERTAEQRACMEAAADGVAAESFELHFNEVRYVSRREILWLGTGQLPPPLLGLVKRLSSALMACGYEPEHRPFQAHVTLMRKLHHPPRVPLTADLHWPVEQFALVRSELTRAGAIYTVLRRWPLTGSGVQG